MPLLISEALGVRGSQGINATFLEPGCNVVVVELFGPQHSRHRLPEYQLLFGVQTGWHHMEVKGIAVLLAEVQDLDRKSVV